MPPPGSPRNWQELRVLLSRLRNQLWDASRTMDKVQRVFPKDKTVTRARKDVNAALHEAYLVYMFVRENDPDASLSSSDNS